MAAVVLWTALGVVAYVYVGYPLLLFVISRVASRPVRKAQITPSVTIIIAAYNEQDAIAAKIENSLALDYPPGLLEVMVASDGSTDAMNAFRSLLGLPATASMMRCVCSQYANWARFM